MTALLLLLPAARADIVGVTQEEGYIHRYEAPNGQSLYFASPLEEPWIEFQDVNFDGVEDIVILTILGASNAFYEFFVWNGGDYVRANRPDGSAIINYALDERGYVYSRGSNGMAGALFEARIFRWQGRDLIPVRTMVSQEETTTRWEEDEQVFITTTRLDRITVRLWGDQEEPLWEATFAPEQKSYTMFEEMETRLWEGLGG